MIEKTVREMILGYKKREKSITIDKNVENWRKIYKNNR